MNVPLTPLDFIERARRVYGPLEAVVDGDRRFTWTEHADRCHRLAHALRDEWGCEPGDRVAWLGPNTHHLLEAYYGVVLAGCVLAPLNIRNAAAEHTAALADCTPSVLFVHPSTDDVAAAVVTDARRVVVGEEYEDALTRAESGPFPTPPFSEDDVCEIFYTSGSTGDPKGVMLTHRNLSTHAIDTALTGGIDHRDVVLHTIPLFHVNGWGTPHYIALVGGRHVLLHRFDPADVLRLVEEERVTRLSLVPTMATAIVTHPDVATRDLSSLRQSVVGGAPPTPALLAELEERLGCEAVCGYGLSEASPSVTRATLTRAHDGLGAEERRARLVKAGLPLHGVDARVLGDDDAEVSWDGVTQGEICVRSNHVMAGYWNNPEETAQALRDGWLRTGDIAVVDAEGSIEIVDRKKDIIVSGGENISSVQVERVLCDHPAVLEAAVVGMPDERWGEVPRAFVTLRPGAAAEPDELIGWVRDHLAHFKAPKRVDIRDEMPKGGTGKILKAVLRKEALA